jgi:hypothetical protein
MKENVGKLNNRKRRKMKGGKDKYKNNSNKKFWEDLIAYFPLIRQRQHKKRRVQKFFYLCVCVVCSGKVYTELLPRMRGIYEVRR